MPMDVRAAAAKLFVLAGADQKLAESLAEACFADVTDAAFIEVAPELCARFKALGRDEDAASIEMMVRDVCGRTLQ